LRKAQTIEKGLTAEIIENQCNLHVIRRKTHENTSKERGWRLPGHLQADILKQHFLGLA
jgi:hypothetical protein